MKEWGIGTLKGKRKTGEKEEKGKKEDEGERLFILVKRVVERSVGLS